VDGSLDLRAIEADIQQSSVVEFVQPQGGGTANEIANEGVPTGSEKLSERTRCRPCGGLGDL